MHQAKEPGLTGDQILTIFLIQSGSQKLSWNLNCKGWCIFDREIRKNCKKSSEKMEKISVKKSSKIVLHFLFFSRYVASSLPLKSPGINLIFKINTYWSKNVHLKSSRQKTKIALVSLRFLIFLTASALQLGYYSPYRASHFDPPIIKFYNQT